MPKQERGIEWYETPAGDKRYRVRWWDGKTHRSRSFSKLKDARSFYTESRSAAERRQRLSYAATQKITLAEFVLKTWARFPDPLSDAFIGCPTRETLAEWSKRGELLRFAEEYAGKICRFFESEAANELFVLLSYCPGTPSSPSWGLIPQSEA